MMENKENTIFKKWCLGYSGFDGGDIGNVESPSIWVCGIEAGGGHTPEVLLSYVNKDVTQPPIGYDQWRDNLAYIYNWQVVKLLTSIDGRDVLDYKNFAEKVQPFVHGKTGYFKMNLYPMAFKDTNIDRWISQFSKITGFNTKSEYLEWCAEYRFPQIRKLTEISRPKLIICLGKTYLPQFKAAFFGNNQFTNHEIIDDRELIWTRKLDGTLIVIIPFMVNRHGLVKNVSIQKFGNRISELLGITN